jgi:hypothetical protein
MVLIYDCVRRYSASWNVDDLPTRLQHLTALFRQVLIAYMRESATERLSYFMTRSVKGRKIIRAWLRNHPFTSENLFLSETELRALADAYNQVAKEGSRWEIRIVTEECDDEEAFFDAVIRKGVCFFMLHAFTCAISA